MRNTALKEGLIAPKIDPVISLHFKSAKEVDFVIRVPVPVKKRGHYQQKIVHRYLERTGHPKRPFSPRPKSKEVKKKDPEVFI